MLDRRIELQRTRADAALDQPVGLFPAGLMHRSVKALAVEPMRIHIMEEVSRGDRRVGLVERKHDSAGAGVDSNRHLLSRGCGLRESGSTDKGKQRGGDESDAHRDAHSKAAMNASTRAFPLWAKSL